MSPETTNLLLVLFGLVFVLFGVWILLRAKKFQRRRRAQTVAVCREISRYSGEYHLVYVYTVNGVEYSQWVNPNTFRTYSSLQKMVGQESTVFYDPDDPNIYAFDKNNEFHIKWQMLLCIVLGIAAMAFGFYSMLTGQ